MMRIVILLCLALGACSSSKALPVATGPAFAFNAGMWAPTSADLTVDP